MEKEFQLLKSQNLCYDEIANSLHSKGWAWVDVNVFIAEQKYNNFKFN